MALVPQYLNTMERAFLAAWRTELRELCAIAGLPDRELDLVAAGADASRALALLSAAQAEQLRPDEPLQLLEDMDAAELAQARALLPGPPAEGAAAVVDDFDAADAARARLYGQEVVNLCRIAGFAEYATGFLDRAAPIRVLRSELQQMQREQSAASGPISTFHLGVEPASGRRPIDAAGIYQARARAMGQIKPGIGP